MGSTATAPPPPAGAQRRRLVLTVLLVGAALGVVALLAIGPATPSPEAAGSTTVLAGSTTVLPDSTAGASSTDVVVDEADGVVDEQDGVLPDGVTVFDDEYPGIARLDPDLLAALRAAATDAADVGITFLVHSAWRSPEYQELLLRDAIAEHGSEEEAARWVATPERSLHVSGDAIDIDGTEARAWVAENGAGYGLCRTYDNEPWHVELHPGAVTGGCPPPYADPTQDPRLQP